MNHEIRYTILIIVVFFCLPSFAQDYYPLEIGNSWSYVSSIWEPAGGSWIDTFSVEVQKDTLMPNGHRYYYINQSDFSGVIVSSFVRADSNFIYYYTDSLDIAFYKLKATVGEQWTAHYNLLELISIDTLNIFNNITRILNYRVDGLILRYVSFSDKFGPIAYNSPGEPPGFSYTDIYVIGSVLSDSVYGQIISNIPRDQPPEVFYLSQNYPNPFNPKTIIEYRIPYTAFININLYNLSGQKIREIYKGKQIAGLHNIEINGRSLSSGMYFYELRMDQFRQVKKCLLVK